MYRPDHFRQRVSALVGLGLVLAVLLARPAAAQSESVVKVYPCPAGQATVIAERIRNEFGAIGGVRVAADERTSQVIALAPAEVQSRISQRLGLTAPNRPATPATAAAPVVRSVQLRRLKAEQIESALASMLGNRFALLPAQSAQPRRHRLALAGGGELDVAFDAAAGRVNIGGSAAMADALARMVQVLDSPGEGGSKDVRLLPLRAPSASVQRAAATINNASVGHAANPAVLSMLFQPREQNARPTTTTSGTAASQPGGKPADGQHLGGLLNPVQIEMLEGLDVLVLRGSAPDVEQVMEIIQQVERLSAETEPAIEILELKHVDCQSMGDLVRALYNEVFLPRQGNVSITPVVKPNALLIVGRPENVRTVADVVGRLDQPVAPGTQFEVFHLRYANAASAQSTIQTFFADRGGLGTLVRVTTDARTNALVVQASARDMAEVAELIRRIDTTTSAAVNEVRIFQLEHSVAQDIASILQSAIGSAGGAPAPAPSLMPGLGAAGQPAAARPQGDQRSAMLRFLTVDARGRKLLNSGILSDVRITADVHANALVVSAPPENMELLEALIRQLDRLPTAEAQIKVFTIVNGDASSLSEMLKVLFATQGGPGQALVAAMQTAVSGTDNSLIALRFAVDTRTNSIIACGAAGDLNVVEAILTRLDDSEVRHRRSVVFRLKNSPATQVANTINEFLRSERQVQQIAPGLTSPFEQIEHEVVVTPEPVSNSLVLSATPRFFEEVKGIIEQLDARPPMVMIQVLIAQIELGSTNEFGVEVGLQDSVLFDRSLLSNLQTITTTTYPTVPNQPTVSTQSIVSAENTPGFNFNNGGPLGNSGSDKAVANAGTVGGQSLSSFGVGRSNSQLGYGGLVLSAASENVSVLLRALAENHRVEVLQRPQIMTLDNQPAFIQVGQRVPRITGTQVNNIGQVNTIALENVGLILGVTPRISPDGLVVMQIDAEKSELESEATGIPVTSTGGQIIRSPIIDATMAQTTVSALSDQTVVLGGLIAKRKNESHRKVPWLGDIPLLGTLFRMDSTTCSRSELLIIMTPHIVRNEADADAIKRAEASRMSWCMCDVVEIYGEAGLRRRTDDWTDAETQVVYPDMKHEPGATPQPGHEGSLEPIPIPAGVPMNSMPVPPTPVNPVPLNPTPVKPAPVNPFGPLPEPAGPAAPLPPPAAEPPPADQGGMPRGAAPVEAARYQGPWPPAFPAAQPAVYQQPVVAPPPRDMYYR